MPQGQFTAADLGEQPTGQFSAADITESRDSEVPKPSLWQRANTGLVSGNKVLSMLAPSTAEEIGNRKEQIGEALPGESPNDAYWRTLREGVAKSGADVLSSLTSPMSLALTAVAPALKGAALLAPSAGPALNTASKAIAGTSGALFGAEGARQMLTPQQPGESEPDALQRRLQGGANLAMGTAGVAASGAPQKIADEISETWNKRNTKGFPTLPEQGARGAEQIFRAAAPTETQQNFRENVKAAAGDLAEIGRQLDLSDSAGGIVNPDRRFNAAETAIRDHLKQMYQAEREPQIARNSANPVQPNFSPDAKEGLEFLSKSAGTSDGRALASRVLNAQYPSLGDVDAVAMLANKELIPFERKTGTQQVVTEQTSRRIGALKALDRDSGTAIANELQRRGEPGIREYERRAAALHDIADRLGRRDNAVSLLRGLPGWNFVKSVIGGKPNIASASQAAVSSTNPGRTLQKGFENLANSGLVPNRPVGTGPVPIAGLLTPGAVPLPQAQSGVEVPASTVPGGLQYFVPRAVRKGLLLSPGATSTPPYGYSINQGLEAPELVYENPEEFQKRRFLQP